MRDGRFSGKGLVARLAVAFPEPLMDREERLAALPEAQREGLDSVPVPPEVALAYYAMIRELAVEMYGGAVVTAGFTPQAQARLAKYTSEIRARRRSGGDLSGPLSRWAAKSAGRAARWALMLHVGGLATKHGGARAVGMLIGLDTVEHAIEVEEWFIANARAAFGVADTGDDVSMTDAKAFVAWLLREHAKAPWGSIKLSRILQHGSPQALVRRASGRDKAVELLVDLNYLREVDVDGKGKQKADGVLLNPSCVPGSKYFRSW